MPVNDEHPKYTKHLPQWIKCRDVVAGEEAVKEKGSTYLPMLSDQEDSEYTAYRDRALFLTTTGRTVEGLSGAIMRKAPAINFPDNLKNLEKSFSDSAESLTSVSSQVLEEILSVGRVGVLVDAPADIDGKSDPYATLYRAEEIINWKTQIIDDRLQLTLVVLEERDLIPGQDAFGHEKELKYRVLRLVNRISVDSEGFEFIDGLQYIVEIWRKVENAENKELEEQWEIERVIEPMMHGGRAMDFIPFTFINPTHTKPAVEKSPVLGVCNVNLSHYRTSADLEHGRHFTALPTAFVAGFDTNKTKLKIGSSRAWVSDDPRADAKYLEFTGAGLKSLKDGLDEKQQQMAILGARLLESQRPGVEAAETIKIKLAGEQSALSKLSSAASAGLTKVMQWMALWAGTVDVEKISIELNDDFNMVGIDSKDMLALWEMFLGGGISYDSLFWNLQKGEVIPENREADDELRLISSGPNLQPGEKTEDAPSTDPEETAVDDEEDENEDEE